MPKFGSSSIFYLVAGRSLLGAKPKTLSYKITAQHEEALGLGDTVLSSLPTGVSAIGLEQGGAFFDTTNAHTYLSDVADSVQETMAVICAGFGGNTIALPFVGFEGAFTADYDVVSQVKNLTKANTKFGFNGALEQGVILHPLAARTIDTNGTTVDQLASSAAGGAGYLQVTAFEGLTDAVITIQDSPDDSVWSDLITFSTVTGAPTAERLTVAGAVDRYVRAIVNVTGAGSVTFFVGFKRN